MQDSRNKSRIREKLMIWAGRAIIALALLCVSYFIFDIVRILRIAYAP
jgi:hypothetical protein